MCGIAQKDLERVSRNAIAYSIHCLFLSTPQFWCKGPDFQAQTSAPDQKGLLVEGVKPACTFPTRPLIEPIFIHFKHHTPPRLCQILGASVQHEQACRGPSFAAHTIPYGCHPHATSLPPASSDIAASLDGPRAAEVLERLSVGATLKFKRLLPKWVQNSLEAT
eukprot:1153356-Pelagomonas_calceolata.AAC.1